MGLKSEESDTLIEALQRGRPRLRWIMAQFRLAKEESEDLLQDLALLAVRKSAEIENLENWLVGTARNLCLMRVRARRRREWVSLHEGFEPACPPEQERLDLALDLDRALAVLGPGPRQLIVLRTMGFSNPEAASQTGYAVGSVSKARKLGIEKLTAQVGGGISGGRDRRPRLQRTDSLPLCLGVSPLKLVECLARRYADTATGQIYRCALRAFAVWLGSNDESAAVADLLSVGKEEAIVTVTRYRTALLEEGAADGTINVRLTALRVVVSLARECGLVDWRLEVSGVARGIAVLSRS